MRTTVMLLPFLLVTPALMASDTYDSANFVCYANPLDYYDPSEAHNFTLSGAQYTSYGSIYPVEIIQPLKEDNGEITVEFEEYDAAMTYFHHWRYEPKLNKLTTKVVSMKANGDIIWPVTGTTRFERCQARFW